MDLYEFVSSTDTLHERTQHTHTHGRVLVGGSLNALQNGMHAKPHTTKCIQYENDNSERHKLIYKQLNFSSSNFATTNAGFHRLFGRNGTLCVAVVSKMRLGCDPTPSPDHK